MLRLRMGFAATAAAALALLFAPAEAVSKPKFRLFETFSSSSKAAPEPHLGAADGAVAAHPRDAAEAKAAETDVVLPHLPSASLPSFDTVEAPSDASKLVEVAKVLDLPDTPEFQREDGSYVDLGWRYVGKTGG